MAIASIFEVLIGGFAATAVLTPVARSAGLRLGVHARPSSDRWHRQPRPIPKTGGAALIGAFLLAVILSGVFPSVWPLVMLGSSMFAIGVIDDLRPVGPVTKLVCQLLATGAYIYAVGPVTLTGWPIIDLAIRFAWIVGITNAFNLLDNIDGLAAGVAAIAMAFFATLLLMRGSPALAPLALVGIAIVGVCLAFLVFNLHPASIFMGDSGSHFLGSTIAGATLLSSPPFDRSFSPVTLVPIVILCIPILDTAFVAVTRSLSGRSAFIGGRDHLSHRLVALGLGDRRAVLVLYALAFVGGFVAVGVGFLSHPAAWGLAIAYLLALVATGTYLAHVDTGAIDNQSITPPLPTEVTSRYRIYEVLSDAVLLALGYYLAFVARFHGPELAPFLPYFYKSLPLVVAIQLIPLWLSGKYRQVWRRMGPAELFHLARALLTGVAASVIVLLYLSRFEGYSRSVFLYDAIIAPGLVLGVGVALGALDDYLRLRRGVGRAAIIVGAGRGGVLALHELLQNAELNLMPIGFVDDDPRKRRLRIEGLPVLGTLPDLAALLKRTQATTVIVSIRDLSRETFDRVCVTSTECGVDVRRIRFSLEDVSWRDHTPGIVRFPGAS